MHAVGMTGGIGCGKSFAETYFKSQNITIIDADNIARALVEPGSPTLTKIVTYFGPNILTGEGALNRRKLREIIFEDETAKTWLNNLMHPQIHEALKQAIQAAPPPYCVASVALLIENQLTELFDRILVIDCAKQNQIHRVCVRDGVSPESVEAIMSAQASREERLALADDVIDNNGTLEDFEASLEKLHHKYLVLAG